MSAALPMTSLARQNRVLRGDEVELPAVMTKMDSSDDFMNSFSDDDETCSMRAASTVCSQANEKRINELESQLAELRQTMMLLLQKQGAKPASQPPEKVRAFCSCPSALGGVLHPVDQQDGAAPAAAPAALLPAATSAAPAEDLAPLGPRN